jgi:phosphate transport system substrate-binding protein
MYKPLLSLCVAALVAVSPVSASAQMQRDYVWAAGSSTVFPFATRVAEYYMRKYGTKAPKIESLGTGGGIKLFCSGLGGSTPDVANASRPMKPSEYEMCQKNGVGEIIELQIGYDGVVIAMNKQNPDYDFRLDMLYLALSKDVLRYGAFDPNPYVRWNQISAGLPGRKILVYGPPSTSGTRDAFVELGMESGGAAYPLLRDIKGRNEKRFKQLTGSIREDGRYVNAGENDNATLSVLTKTPDSLGVFGYSFYEENKDKVKVAKIDGVLPTPTDIASGRYPLARSLFIYVKKAHLKFVPGLEGYMNEFVSDAAAGKGGYLKGRGLIALDDSLHDQVKQAARMQVVMAAPDAH